MSYLIQHAINLAVKEYGEDWLNQRPLFEELPEVTGTWYVVLTLPRHEAIAAAGLIGRRFGAYYPQQIRSVKVNAVKRKSKSYPMFPGYIFVSFDVKTERWKRVNSIAGVRKVLMVEEKPVPIAEEAMIRIREKEAEMNTGKSMKAPPMPVHVGAWVQIVEHFSFTGLFGRVVETDARKQAVTVELLLFGSPRPVQMSVNQVKVV